MSGINQKAVNKCSACLELGHLNQLAAHGIPLATRVSHCAACAEEKKILKFGNENRVLNLESEYHKSGNSSFAHSVINMVGMLIGLGQLSTPYALENGGWSSVFLLVGIGIACAYTSHLLGKCLQEDDSSKSYQDIGKQAYGKKGRFIACTFIYLEIFFALVSYTVSLSDNLSVLFSGAQIKISWLQLSTSQLLTVIAVLIALPGVWLRDLSSISFLSFGGILMSLLIFSTVCSIAAFGVLKTNMSIPVFRLRKIPGISGLYIFSYAGHIVFPNLYKAMKDPSKFTKVSITSFSLVTILYAALAFLGAKLFGPAVSSQITLSMPRHLVVTKIALWATVLTPMTKYALEFAPFAIQLEHSLPSSMATRSKILVRGFVGSVLLLLILVLALTLPYFEYVVGLTGSLVSSVICLVLPCVFYLKICWPRVGAVAKVINVVLIVAGGLFGVAGTVFSSRSLLESIRRSHSR